MNICEEKKCTGCLACRNICPMNAITIGFTDLGKTVPRINEDLCINCKQCEKICPVNKTPNFRLPQKTLAAWTYNETDRIKCSSGGIASAIYRSILENGGVIYGCDYDSDLKPIIRRSTDISDIVKFQSSKYVQSSTEYSYREVREDLINNRMVLYIGSPCQIDGLYNFLGQCYDNLITIDLICHGVPPYKYLQEYVEKLAKSKDVTYVGFRGEYDYYLAIYKNENMIYKMKSWDDYYFNAFSKGAILRDNCYECRYARKERIADITIGDFWGIDRNTLKENCDGRISVVLCNTEKGLNVLSGIKDIHVEERTLEEALKENLQLNHPVIAPSDRAIFVGNYHKGIMSALKSTQSGKEISRRLLKRKVPFYKLVKKILLR